MQRVIVAGSPRKSGRSVMLAEEIFEECIDAYPQDEVILIPLCEINVGACQGCMACEKKVEIYYRGKDDQELTKMGHRCVFDDDMAELYELFESADELIIVTPVYFSGNTSLFKGLLDRFQPYYWDREYRKMKRPATVHVIGEGGDPYGYSPLITEIASSLSLAGFALDTIVEWVGRIDGSNEIIEDGKQFTLREFFEHDNVRFRSRFLEDHKNDISSISDKSSSEEYEGSPKVEVDYSKKGRPCRSEGVQEVQRRSKSKKLKQKSGDRPRLKLH